MDTKLKLPVCNKVPESKFCPSDVVKMKRHSKWRCGRSKEVAAFHHETEATRREVFACRALLEKIMKKCLPELLLLSVLTAVALPQAWAADGAGSPKKVVEKASHKPANRAVEKEEEQQHAATGAGIDFHCELGNKLTVYENAGDSNRIGLRWNKQVHELARVSTTTGANRFENKESGLVWISIPSKSMLLDAKKGQQLANECRTRDQTKTLKAAA